jgi:multidrug resistance efflux pump
MATEPGQTGPEVAGASRAPLLAAAMDEAIDQGVMLVANHSVSDTTWITLAHRQMLSGHVGTLVTVPLQGGDQPLGAITLQWAQAPAPHTLQALTQAIDKATPWLALQRLAHRPWHWHARQALAEQWRQAWHGERRQAWRLGAAAALAATLIPVQDDVGARARTEGAQQRVLVAPTDGFIKAMHAHPGDKVSANQVLADLAEQDLKIERDKWRAQVAQQDNAYASAMTKADRSEAAMALSRLEEAQAQLALVDEQLQRSQLRAPFDGVLIQGDLSQRIGAPVKQGDALLTVASTTNYRAIVEVDEHDIARVREGQTGALKLSSLPWDSVPIKVQRITPLAQARDGQQIYEVQASFTQALPEGVRPGLIGQARIDTGYRPLLWQWVRPVADRLALLGWSWWG